MKNNIIILNNFYMIPFYIVLLLVKRIYFNRFHRLFCGAARYDIFYDYVQKIDKEKKTIIWRIIEHRKTRLQCASRKISNFPPCQICILSWIHLLFFIIWFVSKFVQDIWICFFLCKYLILIVSIITVYFNFTL